MATAFATSSMCMRTIPRTGLKQSSAKSFAKAIATKRAPTVSRAQLSVRAEGFEGDSWYPGAEGPAYLDKSMRFAAIVSLRTCSLGTACLENLISEHPTKDTLLLRVGNTGLNSVKTGDYGFDPLRLGGNASALPYYQEAELMNGRWAMMAVAGIIFTDLFGLGPWWTVGAQPTAIPLNILVAIEVVVMGLLEAKRIEGFKKTGKSGVLSSYPFDPMGMCKDAETEKKMKVKEVKNARLAMVAFVGMCSQAAVTGMGPVEGLKAHIADPTNVNIYTSAVGGEVTAAIIALSVAPVIISAQKSLSGDSEEEFRPIPW